MMEAAFYENFIEADGTGRRPLDAAPAPAGGEGEALVVRSSPTGGSNDLKRLYLLALAAAKRSVDITTPTSSPMSRRSGRSRMRSSAA